MQSPMKYQTVLSLRNNYRDKYEAFKKIVRDQEVIFEEMYRGHKEPGGQFLYYKTTNKLLSKIYCLIVIQREQQLQVREIPFL